MCDDSGVTVTHNAEPNVAPRSAPRNRADPRARTLWRLGILLLALPLLGVAGLASWALTRTQLAAPVQVAPLVVAAAAIALAVFVVPELRWRHQRYEIGADEVDLQHGLLTVTRTLIPIARIQHVETRRGLIERRLGLATVVVYTAAGSSEIPALATGDADAVRDRIATLARTEDDV